MLRTCVERRQRRLYVTAVRTFKAHLARELVVKPRAAIFGAIGRLSMSTITVLKYEHDAVFV